VKVGIIGKLLAITAAGHFSGSFFIVNNTPAVYRHRDSYIG
jgi:hypothetical protein